jgi:hypothetical protein
MGAFPDIKAAEDVTARIRSMRRHAPWRRGGVACRGARAAACDAGDCTRSPCCAPAASGHAAAPPSPATNSRRRRQMRIWPSLARKAIEAD